MRNQILLALATAALLGFAAAYAEPTPAPAAAAPCKADIEKFCKDAKKSRRARDVCLLQHEAELSETCKARIAWARSRPTPTPRQSVCLDDVKKLCSRAKSVWSCMQSHEAELSPACRQQISKTGKTRRATPTRLPVATPTPTPR